MKITSSYKAEIIGMKNIFLPTVKAYQAALRYLIGVYDAEWEFIQCLNGTKRRFNRAERLVHGTKGNKAKYPEFDRMFYKMPSYLRRSAIQAALGAVASYRSLVKNWESGGCKGAKPKLQCSRNSMPVFYRGDMFKETENPFVVNLKLLHKNDWVWVPIQLLPTDVRYLQHHWAHCKPSAPTLEKHYGKYYLRFAYEENVSLNQTPIKDQTICAVDLGVNTDAVCCIMRSDGTVAARKFVNFPADKDHLSHVLNRIKRTVRENGAKSTHGEWMYASRINREHAIQVAAAIFDFAKNNNVDTIVFEHLDFKGKIKGSKKQRLHMWRKNDIQALVEHRAHRNGMHVSRICAWGTSKLAFDGSGEVLRGRIGLSEQERSELLAMSPKERKASKGRPETHCGQELCTFQNGKEYNCDLSASYNIGARYFIREILKPLSETARSPLLAKVPEAERRTSATLSTLLRLHDAMAA